MTKKEPDVPFYWREQMVHLRWIAEARIDFWDAGCCARVPKVSVDRADGLFDGEQHDHPFDLTPVAEMDVVAAIATLVRTLRSLDPGMVAVELDQRRRIIIAAPVGEHR